MRCCPANRCAPPCPAAATPARASRAPSTQVDAAWQRLLSGWLPTSGLQLDARPLLEHYPVEASFDPETGVFDCKLCIPVKPL